MSHWRIKGLKTPISSMTIIIEIVFCQLDQTIFGDYSKTSYRFSFPAFFLLCNLIGGLKLKTKFWINPLLFPALFQKPKGKGHFKRSKFTLNLHLPI